MADDVFDIIVIGAGSGGLSIGLFMAQAGFKVLMVSKNDHDIGGDCLNDGCVPSKAIIHVAGIVHNAKIAEQFGFIMQGNVNMHAVKQYILERQAQIREHENAVWLQQQGIHVALGAAHFTGKNEIEVAGKKYRGKKIVIATGSQPKKLQASGIAQVKYLDNESLFDVTDLPKRLLVIGGGPIGIEMAQAISRLGSQVTIIHNKAMILGHDDKTTAKVLLQQLKKEGIICKLNAKVEQFSSAHEAIITTKENTQQTVAFDAVFVATGRELRIETLQLQHAGIAVKDGRIIINAYLQTTNKNVFVCGDVAGDLKFSHAAEFHARIIINNLFSPFNKKLDNRHMSWVTFTQPELAGFGLNEAQLKQQGIAYHRLQTGFQDDDRAVTDDYRYATTVLFISAKGLFKKQKILGGSMVAPHAGELVQELILANSNALSINTIFNKIYPYPVAARINQKLIVDYKAKSITAPVKKLLAVAYKLFG